MKKEKHTLSGTPSRFCSLLQRGSFIATLSLSPLMICHSYELSVTQTSPTTSTVLTGETVTWEITIHRIRAEESQLVIPIRITDGRSSLLSVTSSEGASNCDNNQASLCLDLSQSRLGAVTTTVTARFDNAGQRTIYFRDTTSVASEQLSNILVLSPTPEAPNNDQAEVINNFQGNQSQMNMAETLNTACTETTKEAFLQLCDEIRSLSSQEQSLLVADLTPDEIIAQGSITLNSVQSQFDIVKHRLNTLRIGGIGLDLVGLTAKLDGQEIPVGQLATIESEKTGSEKTESEKPSTLNFGLFAQGHLLQHEWNNQNPDEQYEADTHEFMLGIDFQPSPNFYWGTAFSYAKSDTAYKNSDEDFLDISSHSLLLYSSYLPVEDFFVDSILILGKGQMESLRGLNYLPSVSSTLKAKTSARHFGLSLKAGADYQNNLWNYGPYASIDFIRIGIEDYQEENDSIELTYDDQTIESITSAMGLHIARTIALSNGVLLPSITADWRHEFEPGKRVIQYTLNGSDSKIKTKDLDEDYLSLTFSTSIQFKSGPSGFFSYSKKIDHNNLNSYNLAIGTRFTF